MATRIFLVVRDLLFGGALQTMLDQQPDLVVVGMAGDADRAVLQTLLPDLVLVAKTVPTPDELRALAADFRLILLAGDDERDCAMRSLGMGVRAVLGAEVTPGQLLATIRMVALGEFLIVPMELRNLFGSEHNRQPTDSAYFSMLTCRESEVLHLIGSGMSNSEIAGRLCVSATTVRSHVHHILGKLCVQSRAQAIALAYQNGLMPA
jgi:DNA-binding NarL/FixJ family response regulator